MTWETEMMTICPLLCCLAIQSTPTCSQEPSPGQKIYSGPQRGESAAPFRTVRFTGGEGQEVWLTPGTPRKGQAKPKVTLVVFSHKMTYPSIGLLMLLELYSLQEKAVAAHFVVLADEVTRAEAKLTEWQSVPVLSETPFHISLDGPQGPGRYGLNRKVHMTVLVLRETTVVDNIALIGPNTKTDVPRVLKAVSTALGSPAPSLDKLREDLKADRRARRGKQILEMAGDKELGRLMVDLVFGGDLSAGATMERADVVRRWADSEPRRKVLRQYCNKILQSRLQLPAYAKKSIETLAKPGEGCR